VASIFKIILYKTTKYMKKQFIGLMAIGMLCCFSACDSGHNNTANGEDATKVADSANDKKFDDSKIEDDAEWAVKAADGGMEEVALGKLAEKMGTNPKVKELGKMMVEDHTKANDELKALAAKKNITLPAAMSEERQKECDDLAKKTGADFDREYTKMMVDDHEDDIDKFQSEADHGKDADVKAWAAGKVPVLQHHLEMAKAARDAVK
jgi:putative membrane protein